jgi:hypothetical protein
MNACHALPAGHFRDMLVNPVYEPRPLSCPQFNLLKNTEKRQEPSGANM